MLLLDASVWVAAGVPAHQSHAAAVGLIRGEREVGTLDLALYEVANTVGLRYRSPEQAGKLCALIRRRCADEPARVDARLVEITLEEVAKHGLSAYDAAYVALAEALDTTLLTGDRRLANATGPRCRIELMRSP